MLPEPRTDVAKFMCRRYAGVIHANHAVSMAHPMVLNRDMLLNWSIKNRNFNGNLEY